MRTVASFCRQDVPGWDALPYEMFQAYGFSEDQKPYFCSFMKKDEGIQLICDMREGLLHVSLAPAPSTCPEKSRTEIIVAIEKRASEILKEFFGDLEFQRMPDAKINSSLHFFHYFTSTPGFSRN